jgi:hypothetical protein
MTVSPTLLETFPAIYQITRRNFSESNNLQRKYRSVYIFKVDVYHYPDIMFDAVIITNSTAVMSLQYLLTYAL